MNEAGIARGLRTVRLIWPAFWACASPSFEPDAACRGGGEADRFDAECQHILIEDRQTGDLLGCARVMLLPKAAAIHRSYSAQFYDLTRLSGFVGPMLELGRFCTSPGSHGPGSHDPDVLRLAWAALTRIVDAAGVGMLFGCSSFVCADPDRHRGALALLHQRHLGPERWQPGRKSRDWVALDGAGQQPGGPQSLPPLLRTYLAMGGWVSDHAVIDHDLDTLHVFTGLEVAAIPASRAAALRQLAG